MGTVLELYLHENAFTQLKDIIKEEYLKNMKINIYDPKLIDMNDAYIATLTPVQKEDLGHIQAKINGVASMITAYLTTNKVDIELTVSTRLPAMESPFA